MTQISFKKVLQPMLIQIHLDSTGKAYGVTYLRHGQERFVRARKEVIVSAGTIGSAKLLLLSGIGPKQHLKSVGVSLTTIMFMELI